MKISIITPSFNQGFFIERTLKSVSQQYIAASDITLEHIVFDAESKDNTLEVLQRFSSSISWISEQDRGQAHAINKGIQRSKGEIIGWLNSDDIYYPQTIHHIAKFFSENSQVDVVYGMADHIDVNDCPLYPYPTEPWNLERLKEICFICQPAVFFRKKIIEECGFLDESLNYCMDYEYWLRLGNTGIKFSYFEKKLAGSRLYPDNKTFRSRIEVHAEINNMLKKKWGSVPNKWVIGYAFISSKCLTQKQGKNYFFLINFIMEFFAATKRWDKTIFSLIKYGFIQWMRKW